jgi:hypothetical protein
MKFCATPHFSILMDTKSVHAEKSVLKFEELFLFMVATSV